MADFGGWDADGDEAGGPVQAAGTPVVNGGLLDPRTFPTFPAPSTQEAPSIEPAAPELSGPLGQLKFLYPPGSMTSSQIGEMRANLDREQKKFLRPK